MQLELLVEATAATAPITVAVAPIASGAAVVDDEEEGDKEEEDDLDYDAAIINVIEEEIHTEAEEITDAE